MTKGLLHLLIFSFSTLLASARVRTSTNTKTSTTKNDVSSLEKHAKALPDWLRSKEGVFHPNLEIRRTHPEDPTSSHLGVFAKDKIEKDSLLLSVPPDLFIYGDDKDVAEDQYELECFNIAKVVKEMKLGDDSKYAPYMKFLRAQRHNQLPSAWSQAGRDLLHDMLGESLPPFDITGYIVEGMWHNGGCESSDDPKMDEFAGLLLIQHSMDDVLVPIFDIINHRNGRWINTNSTSPVEFREKAEVHASRDIKAGEEIYMSYSPCEDCYTNSATYGTPQILRDCGFIEKYPQRWTFHDDRVEFDVDEKINEAGGSELEVRWVSDKPSPEDTRSLIEELDSLHIFAKQLPQHYGEIPKHEWDTIWKYHEALVIAMKYAVVDATDGKYDYENCKGGNGVCMYGLSEKR